MMLFTDTAFCTDFLDNLLLIIVIAFRNCNIFRTITDTTPQCDMAGSTSHYFNDTASLVGCGCITYFVDCFHRRVAGGVKTDRIFCTRDVKIDCSRNTDRVDSVGRKFLRSAERTVSSNNYDTINAMFTADICCLFLAFRCYHLRATGSVKDGSSFLYNIRYTHCIHIYNIFF